MNRFQNIVDGVSRGMAAAAMELFPQLRSGLRWTVNDKGELICSDGSQDFIFTFEKGDPETEALLLVLNHLRT